MNDMKINEIQSGAVRHVARQFKWMVDTLYSGAWSTEGPAPLVVNGALAIELYLKSFNAQLVFKVGYEVEPGFVSYEDMVTEVLSKAHQPSKLYKDLPRKVQAWLQQEFAEERPGQDLGDWLRQFDGAFVKWRYHYEGNASRVPVTDLLHLLVFFESRSQEVEANNGVLPKK
ncbi:hypothetical protein [Halomonas sp. BC04]|uniref:hypothetical protein n=1 Tax=Halomonas sp. BC04 TaxID=1403540 RepID=UPI0012DF942C|nr:hypothetical protein [Halomonas sp. BC04]